MQEHPALRYFRLDSPGTPHLWCPGCGIGQIWYYTIKAIEELKLDAEKVVWVGGSGCTGRMCTYWNGDYLHALHGRALAFASGIKLARPELTLLCFVGDGDAAAIGGNHLIQTARRNVDITTICVNNLNYGMTGGQFSPTTPIGGVTMTSILGSIEPSFDLCELVKTSGASYAARWTTSHPRNVIDSIKKGILKKGFAFIEVISQCTTQYGRRNRLGDGVQMMRWLRQNSIKRDKAKGLDKEELNGKFIVGEFIDREGPEWVSSLWELGKRLRGEMT